jgi:uncharacterized membrane protein YGL010W
MKTVKVFTLAILAIAMMFYIGANGLSQKLSFGPFFIFVGICTTIGLAMDITNHVKERIRKSNVKKLLP